MLLDRSLSMGHTAVWPAALDSARADRRRRWPPRTGSRVVLFDDEAEVAQPLTGDHGAALAALNAATPVAAAPGTPRRSARRGRFWRGARGLGARSWWSPICSGAASAGLAGLELPADLVVRAVSVAPARRANTAVVGAEVQRVPDGERSKLLVAARVLSRELGSAAPRPPRARRQRPRGRHRGR